METNSLINNLMAKDSNHTPKVGDGATKLCWTDRYPYTVVEVKTPTRIVVQADTATIVSGSAFNGSAVYEYSSNPLGERVELSLRRDGVWRQRGGNQPFHVGNRSMYRDPSF